VKELPCRGPSPSVASPERPGAFTSPSCCCSRGSASGVAFIVLLFACVLAHEFGHILMARRFGIPTPDVTLLPIGGVAMLERMPEKPREQLLVALAGPAVNVVIAAVLLLVLALVSTPSEVARGFNRVEDPNVSLLGRLAAANIVLVLFNMVPAFPMDGGRVLNAILAMRMDKARALRIAARIEQAQRRSAAGRQFARQRRKQRRFARRAIGAQRIRGLVDFAGLRPETETQARAFDHIVRLFDAHVAARGDFIVALIVAQPIGKNCLSGTAQTHGAFGFDLALGAPGDAVGFDVNGTFVPRRRDGRGHGGLGLQPESLLCSGGKRQRAQHGKRQASLLESFLHRGGGRRADAKIAQFDA